MSKFNTVGVAPAHTSHKKTTTTYEGALAYEFSPEMELYQSVVTTLFGEPKFYESGDERTKRIRRMVRKNVESNKADFVAKLAIYTRTHMHLRSIPIFLTVTLANEYRDLYNINYPHLRHLTSRVIQRADEIREMFAAAEQIFGDPNDQKTFKRVAPKSLLRGIGDAFNKFDAYQFKKYSAGKGHVKFEDVLRVVHPKAKDKNQGQIFEQIMNNTLPKIDTWETVISGEGSTTDNWQKIADDPATGYMAKLRNLRNFVKNNVNLDNVISHLTNPHAVEKSKQLPFRFYTAYRELGGDVDSRNNYWFGDPESETIKAPAKLLTALEDAFDLSVKNLPDLGDDVLIVVDQSGSMQQRLSEKGTVSCAEIASVLGAAVWYNQTVNLRKDAMVAGFADTGTVYNWSTRGSSLAAAKDMMKTNLGASTCIDTAWKAAKNAGLQPSTIVVLSDMQMTGGGFDRIMNPEDYGIANENTLKISVNLQGYRQTPFAVNNGWYQIAGWSEKVFDLIQSMRNANDALRLINEEINLDS